MLLLERIRRMEDEEPFLSCRSRNRTDEPQPVEPWVRRGAIVAARPRRTCGIRAAAGFTLRDGQVPIFAVFVMIDRHSEIIVLGLGSSSAFACEREGSGPIERISGALTQQLRWAGRFAMREQVAEALEEFRRRSNEQRVIGRLGFPSPP